MPRFTRTLLLSAAALTLATLRAEPTAPTPPLAGSTPAPAAPEAKPAATPPAAAPATPAGDDTQPRRYRSTLAAALADSMPKYDPPKPVVKKAEDDEDVDLRDVDKPKNRIVRLPKYTVQGNKPPIFRERDINTTKGLADIAMRRYLSEVDRALNRFQLPLFGASNETRALAMYEEEQRLKNMADLNETAHSIGKVDPKEAAEIKRMNQDANMRWSDFGYQGKDN
ncbi:MAG: hypothetical protein JSS11_01185 [Verrucomicrobia bacterium]|nr:hypothetical protein [Verrucomicrobiota bacterium]